MDERTLRWVVDWFAARTARAADEVTAMRDENYFDAGLIDSFGVIELIGDIEAEFPVVFDERDFQDRRFATMSGLAGLIDELSEGATG